MIGTISGTITEKSPPQLIIESHGVGYEISAPMTTFYHLPDIEQHIKLYTHLVVREDAHLLYGFHHPRDRALFRALIKVNGVGPKLALTILSGMSADEFVQCIQQNQAARLVSIPGIGKKTAERLIIETRDSLKDWAAAPLEKQSGDNANQSLDDAISALSALGYKANEAKRAVDKIYQANTSSEQLIRLALQEIAKGV